jgi:hypothetical protein
MNYLHQAIQVNSKSNKQQRERGQSQVDCDRQQQRHRSRPVNISTRLKTLSVFGLHVRPIRYDGGLRLPLQNGSANVQSHSCQQAIQLGITLGRGFGYDQY